ncbi:hypothetical protein PUN28_009802 [Cardiocondyla obscurior]|uniref:Uncharacterized protein n=1 Tax=Cardiocondyla obscurior TaxID=286306 RepID=A0AAW2FR98_9HYME
MDSQEIIGLIVCTTCTSIFITIQIYAEGFHLVRVTGEILNSTLMNNPDIDWVPEKWEESVNSILDNAYTYGQSAISDAVRFILLSGIWVIEYALDTGFTMKLCI